MQELLTTALATEGLIWIILAAFLAGLVRGFAGFGTAMIYLPVAGSYLDPVAALVSLMVMDFFGPLPNLPRAWKDARRDQLVKLLIGMLVVLIPASFILTAMSPEIFRYLVSLIALTLLVLLMLGVRYRGEFRNWMLYGTGGLGGFLGGVAGVPGPPVIMIYMASENPPAVIRAVNMLYLWFFDFAFAAIFLLRGLLSISAIGIGAVVTLPYLLGNVIGQRIFDPNKETLYRWVAYVIIAISALRGLPIWG
ncbi:MAG: sulfite exporter TauE/SafE family protein [Pseudomonadota bacterium]